MQVASSSDTDNRQHVKNVEQAFEQLSEPAKAEKCPGIRLIRGLMEKVEINRDERPHVQDSRCGVVTGREVITAPEELHDEIVSIQPPA